MTPESRISTCLVSFKQPVLFLRQLKRREKIGQAFLKLICICTVPVQVRILSPILRQLSALYYMYCALFTLSVKRGLHIGYLSALITFSEPVL
jgi:hypothetical protein